METYERTGRLYYVESEQETSTDLVELFLWEDICCVVDHLGHSCFNDAVIIKEFEFI